MTDRPDGRRRGAGGDRRRDQAYVVSKVDKMSTFCIQCYST